MRPFTIASVVIFTIASNYSSAFAQPLSIARAAGRSSLHTVRQVEIDGDGPKNKEIEGVIWEYKIVSLQKSTSTTSKPPTTLRGKLRIKGNAIYAVGDEPKIAEQEHRVGDVSWAGARLKMIFDDHPDLDGRFILEPLRGRKEGGVYVGYYVDEKKERWKLELRRGED